MIKRGTLLVCILFAPFVINAQESTYHVSTSVPDTARFEIVQSSVLVRLTFRIDKHTGRNWHVAEKTDGAFVWEEMYREGADDDQSDSEKPHYQIFSSGILAKQTILMNTDTGESWYVVEDSDSELFWTLFD